MEVQKVEEFEEAEVVCGQCIGSMTPVQIQSPRLFKKSFYKKMVLHCNVCNKTSKPFSEKIKQQ